MQEVTIKYKDTKTLMILKVLAKYLDFVVSTPKEEKKRTATTEVVNGVTLIRGDKTIDTSDLSEIFTGRNIDAKKLRQQAWKRKK